MTNSLMIWVVLYPGYIADAQAKILLKNCPFNVLKYAPVVFTAIC